MTTCPVCQGAAHLPPDPTQEPGRTTRVWCRTCAGTGHLTHPHT